MAKKALLIGINYIGTSNRLNGCANDMLAMRQELQKNGYTDITLISDDYARANYTPSRENILAQLRKIVDNAQPGDEIFFHYSGHGSYTRDLNADEPDGRDETICAISDGEITDITDDELKKILQNLPYGVKLAAIMDCCHSASVFDLKNNIDKPTTKITTERPHGYTVMLSGCQDNQTSADAFLSGKYQGAMTASFLAEVKKNGFKSVLDTLYSNSRSQLTKLRTSLYSWLRTNSFVQKPDISYEGLLPKSVPVLPSYRAAQSRYPLRQTQARQEREHQYKEMHAPLLKLA
ncbi:caspase family protein [Candidatus Berkiella aquae]|uniref:Caspase domain protein n=1 Tax=Candidatus Berkiella aquae TaxID=295108 RepID=A0A0Q9YDS5_9GAMM|nr:caspase family protein [Candidatus Berkiella aquae]MCS5709943.1 caspase family protein [Candidatus Berkiella aquae]